MAMRRRPLIMILISGSSLYLLATIFCLSLGLWLWRETAILTSLPDPALISGKKIVLDAGHGGRDPGAKSRTGLQEKDLNLDIALRLKKYFSRVGVYCIMIRETDCDHSNEGEQLSHKQRQDLINRTRIANENDADLYLSIHANSFPQTQYRGAQTFYDPDSPAAQGLAEAIQGELVRRLGPNRRRAKPGDFRVLNDSRMPAVTIEVGFLSNPEEAALLATPAYREKVAEAIFWGVVGYLSRPK
jgi:N-acetylmuramoyl-L-alanine amidase